jgi:hypothetical protein
MNNYVKLDKNGGQYKTFHYLLLLPMPAICLFGHHAFTCLPAEIGFLFWLCYIYSTRSPVLTCQTYFIILHKKKQQNNL